ncbi:alpha/beta hydrolase [Synechococcus sp. L2F]|uniref:alpha/beta family hydrolase n=1 Tax=Synechococcus sp. L2F TaxID=2823739 RepID=UPI0020CBE966|nr:alpha/beta family hydrolase [Synechococcus sp. L2F]MCP9829323.1 alpha/beta hydrolase [Synechococcus sp. L2F]
MTDEAPNSAPRLIDGPDDAPATVLLAHGAGAPIDSPFMAAIASGLAASGRRVVRFAFAYMARMRVTGRRQLAHRMPVLQEAFRQQVRLEKTGQPGRPVFIGGKSMGGRVASLLIDELAASDGVRGCLCLGYPFHPPGMPLQLRTEHLASLQTPTLILQGERDSFGRREEVETYRLSPQVQLRWIPSGDHSFKPTHSSGLSEAENWATAVAVGDQFLRERLMC